VISLARLRAYFSAARAGLAQAWRNWRDPPYATLVVVAQLPATLAPRTLYIVEEDGFQEQAAMVCPCGCGKTLHMNLLTDERPCWRVTMHADATATLFPSVWRKTGCASHFWFRNGRIVWVPTTFNAVD
jgi:hypothetical protein